MRCKQKLCSCRLRHLLMKNMAMEMSTLSSRWGLAPPWRSGGSSRPSWPGDIRYWYLTAGDVASLLLDVSLLVLFGTALSSCVNFPLSANGQGSAVGTIVSAGYGFISLYANLPVLGRTAEGDLLPAGTYGTSLLRNHAPRGVFEEMGAQGFPSEVVETIRESVNCNLYFFGGRVGSLPCISC